MTGVQTCALPISLAEKIQSSVNTAIPLWKNQVVIALTLLRQKDAVTAQRQVSEKIGRASCRERV